MEKKDKTIRFNESFNPIEIVLLTKFLLNLVDFLS